MAKSLLDKIGLEQAGKLMSEATHKAIAEAHAHGLHVTVVVQGITSQVFPTGRIEPAQGPPSLDRAAWLSPPPSQG